METFVELIMRYVDLENDDLREQVMHACKGFFCSTMPNFQGGFGLCLLSAVENMVYKCGKEITPHLNRIVPISLRYVCYDPNYNYGDEDGEDGDEDDMDTEDDGDDDDSDDEYSDDDDMSWKVRRAGAKCLEAVIATRHELLLEFYAEVRGHNRIGLE